MRIGIASIYSARPIPHFMAYLSSLLQSGGHNTEFLTCDAAFPVCVNHLFRNVPRWAECAMCIVGGMRSFTANGITKISRDRELSLPPAEAEKLAQSSAITLSREESTEGFQGELVKSYQRRLGESVRIAHANTLSWVAEKRLDGIMFYNGRMDVTAGMLAACKQSGLPAISVERTLVGHGLWLVPNQNCLSMIEFDRMMAEYRERPLLADQARLAGSFLARRQLRESTLEWRSYNLDAKEDAWPVDGPGRRVLVLPSSRNELEGNEEWTCEYTDMTRVLPRLLDDLGVPAKTVVVRAHPLWASKVGAKRSSPAEEIWRAFAREHGMHFIEGASQTSTQHLINQADLVVLNGSSAAIEAGAAGKTTICFGHSQYQNANVAIHIQSGNDWIKLQELGRRSEEDIVRATLRFAYCVGWRFPQFVNYVRGLKPTEYRFYEGGDVGRILHMFHQGTVLPDDARYDNDTAAEDRIIDLCLQRKWRDLVEVPALTEGSQLNIERRQMFRWVDHVRERLPKGDS